MLVPEISPRRITYVSGATLAASLILGWFYYQFCLSAMEDCGWCWTGGGALISYLFVCVPLALLGILTLVSASLVVLGLITTVDMLGGIFLTQITLSIGSLMAIIGIILFAFSLSMGWVGMIGRFQTVLLLIFGVYSGVIPGLIMDRQIGRVRIAWRRIP